MHVRASGKAYHDEIYRWRPQLPWSTAEIREFRSRYEVRDLFLELPLGEAAHLRLGNQIIAWGVSDYLRITDVINPEDQYTLGQQDLEDLRRYSVCGSVTGCWMASSPKMPTIT